MNRKGLSTFHCIIEILIFFVKLGGDSHVSMP